MKKLNVIVVILYSLLIPNLVYSQELTVKDNTNTKDINRMSNKRSSTIIFESKVDGLEIDNPQNDTFIRPTDKTFIYVIAPYPDSLVAEIGYPRRVFTLTCPKTPELLWNIDEILPNQVLRYTIYMPNQFFTSLSAEYLFTKYAKHGIRLSFGKRIGGYVCYKWGEYKAKGSNIDEVMRDYDVLNANKLGGIRTSITAGLRLGLFQKVIGKTHSALYILLGGGYGEYGRQWNNQHLVGSSTYFYSDYIKGVDGEAAIQCVLFDWLCLSAGLDMVIGKGKISTDYQIGVGVNLNVDKLLKTKKIAR